MRYHILNPIESYDQLGILFNAYMRSLRSLEIIAVPRETMREYGQLLAQDTAAGTQEAAEQALRFYRLQVLVNALTGLYQCVERAGLTLFEVLDHYEGDFQAYAVAQRFEHIELYGSDDEADWNEDGTISHRDDAEGLAQYTLRAILTPYFAGADTRGEAIGTSGPADFAYFSAMVGNPSAFNLRNLLERATGERLQTYCQSEEGDMVAETLGDQLESDLNEDLNGEAVVRRFNTVLELGLEAAALYARLGDENVAGYQQLSDLLTRMMDEAA